MSYNDIIDHIEKNEDDSGVWKLGRITAHEGPLQPIHPDYKGSKYNVMIEWETGEITAEPLSIIAADDPVTSAIYAKQHNLLELDGWKRFKGIATNMVLKYPMTTNMLRNLIRRTVTPNGKMLRTLNCNNLTHI